MLDFVLADVLNPFHPFNVPLSLVHVDVEHIVDIEFWMSNLHPDLDVNFEDYDVDFPSDSAQCWTLMSVESLEVHFQMSNPLVREGLRTFVEHSFLTTLAN